jgi:hypothetical protein
VHFPTLSLTIQSISESTSVIWACIILSMPCAVGDVQVQTELWDVRPLPVGEAGHGPYNISVKLTGVSVADMNAGTCVLLCVLLCVYVLVSSVYLYMRVCVCVQGARGPLSPPAGAAW